MTDTEVKQESNGHSAPVSGSGDHSSNKEEMSNEQLEAKIVRQVEHYFGDYNLPRDKFLKETIQSDDGWVPMEVMLKFQRLASLSTDSKVILSSLKKGGSGLMEVDDDHQKIRRCPTLPLPEWNDARRQELMDNTVYVKGFEKTETTLDDLLEFFGKFPNVLNVSKRLYEDRKDPERKKHFKGSVFVVFKDRVSAQNFMDIKSVKSPDGKEELIRKWQKDYIEEKDKEFNDKRRKKLDEKQSQKKANAFCKSDDNNQQKPKKEITDFPHGALLQLDGFPENGDTTREKIKEKLEEEFGMDGSSLAWMYYTRGQTSAILRFTNENDAKNLAQNMLAKICPKILPENLDHGEFYMKCNQKVTPTVKEGSVGVKEGFLDVKGSLDVKEEESLDVKEEWTLDVKEEGSLDVKEGSLDVKEGSLDVKEGSLNIKEGSLDVKESNDKSTLIEYNQKISFKVLEGEEESHYLEQCKNAINEFRQQGKKGGHKRRGGFNHGKGGKRQRSNWSKPEIKGEN